MTTAPRPGRARRGRVLIVGDIPELARLTSQLVQPPLMAKNLFEALGEISVAPAGAPITTVLLSDQLLQSHAGRAVEAMRKIDPSLRVVLITSNAMSTDWQSQGLDDCITTPIAPADMGRLFEEDMLATATPPPAPPAPPAPAPPAPQAAHSTPPPAISIEPLEVAKHETKAPQQRPEKNPRIKEKQPEESRPPAAVNAPSPAAPPASERVALGTLGDTDLVEAILSSPSGVRDVAIKLIVQQTRWNDLQLLDQHQPGIASAPVSFNNASFGFLSSAQAGSAELQPWADWLARWLAMDDRFREYRINAFQDDLTGAWNRRFFESFLKDSIARAAKLRRPVSVMVFDIDNFKFYNDRFGHDAGDDVLRETVRLLNSVIRQGDRVCRIGGDEFAVVFADQEGPRKPQVPGAGMLPESVEAIAKRFQDQICQMRFPKLGAEAPGPLSISAGLATFPWDGNDPVTLLRHADQLALESKRKGKNAITLGPGAMSACREQAPD